MVYYVEKTKILIKKEDNNMITKFLFTIGMKLIGLAMGLKIAAFIIGAIIVIGLIALI